eukprot:GEMP01038942.1.p1 GENE.GEMP01038942.1~~GEMP01038942.1.p1  ORF type:complete len:444 (+),score=128.07 GEMP01038942.1:119-1450(+)
MAAVEARDTPKTDGPRGEECDGVHGGELIEGEPASLPPELILMRLLRRTSFAVARPELDDFDCYLLETKLASLLLEGLEALARKLEKRPVNPMRWLAQYLLRHRPDVPTGDQTAMESVDELRATPASTHDASRLHARKERGRRELKRRLHALGPFYKKYRTSHNNALLHADLPNFIDALDLHWFLGGNLSSQLEPGDFEKAPCTKNGEVTLEDFQLWMVDLSKEDKVVLVADYFWEGQKMKKEQETLAKKKMKVDEGRVEIEEKRRKNQEQAIAADRFTFCFDSLDNFIGRQLCTGGMELGVEASMQMPIEGPHIQAIRTLLELYEVAPADRGENWRNEPWDEASAEIWFKLCCGRSTADTLAFLLNPDNLPKNLQEEAGGEISGLTPGKEDVSSVIPVDSGAHSKKMPSVDTERSSEQADTGVRVSVKVEPGDLVAVSPRTL